MASGGYKLGNVFENNFRDIWWGEGYQAFRRQLTDASAPWPDPCAVCPLVGKLASKNAAGKKAHDSGSSKLPSPSLG